MWDKLTLFAAVVVSALFVTASITRADECPATPDLPSSDGSQPANLGVLKLQLLDYKCFGAYDRDVANVLSEAKAYLEYRANGSASSRLYWTLMRHRFRICQICWPMILVSFGAVTARLCRGNLVDLIAGSPIILPSRSSRHSTSSTRLRRKGLRYSSSAPVAKTSGLPQ
jgi:hypothetical protein